MIGCKCRVCQSQNYHNKRLRPSGLIQIREKKLLIDTGPDFRYQALKYHLDHLDGVLLTHSHFDHVAGLDELRSYYLIYRKTLPVLVSRPTLDDLKKRYDYLFREKSRTISLTAQLDFNMLEEEGGQREFLGISLQYMPFEQASMPVTGYRFDSFAYISDIRQYSETIFEGLKGVEILVLSALRKESSLMHFNLDEAIAFARKVGAKRTYLTHIGHELDHDEAIAYLPNDIQPAYDGLELEFDYRYG